MCNNVLRFFALLSVIVANSIVCMQQGDYAISEQADLSNKGSIIFKELCNISLKNIKKLDISFNSLYSLPSAIYKITSLQSLNVSNNSLNSLSTEINKLKNLNFLHLNKNNLATWSSGIRLDNLRALDLRDNKFANIPENIASWQNLNLVFITSDMVVPQVFYEKKGSFFSSGPSKITIISHDKT